eukprot:scaffold77913_cov81-Cyclotella_meneghiniana.AAC.1
MLSHWRFVTENISNARLERDDNKKCSEDTTLRGEQLDTSQRQMQPPCSKGTPLEGNSNGMMTAPNTPNYGSPISISSGSNIGDVHVNVHNPSLEKFNASLSEFVMTNVSELLEEERAKHEARYNAKMKEVEELQDQVDELNGEVVQLTRQLKMLEGEKREVEQEMTRVGIECDSMKAFMKSSLNL